MGTGLGPESYALIEQGRIGQILSSRPTDRRAIIEEAAGITKFKTEKRLAEARLEDAKLNLARVNDIFEEVTRQMNSLKRQASKAERYGRLRDEMRAKLLLVEFPSPDLQNDLRTHDVVRTLNNPWAGIFFSETIFARRYSRYFLGDALLNNSGLRFFYQSLRLLRRLGSHFSLVPVLRGFGHVILDYDLGRLAGIRTLIDFGIEQRQRHFCHARGLPVASAGEDHIFHACAAQRLGGLFPQYPRDGIRDIGLAAAIRSNDGCHTIAVKLQFGAVAE